MTVVLRKTIPEDAETLARIWLNSLEDNEMVKLASPEGITPKRLQGATKKTLSDLQDPLALCLTAYEKETGEIMGCAVFRYFPDGKKVVPAKHQTEKDKESDTQESNGGPSSIRISDQRSSASKPSISVDLDAASSRIFQHHVGNKPHACELQGSFPGHNVKFPAEVSLIYPP